MDPVIHLYYVSRVINWKMIARFVSAYYIIMYIPIIPVPAFVMTAVGFLLYWFVILFPFYLFFALFVNKRLGWAAAIVVTMGLAYSLQLVWPDSSTVSFLASVIPLFFLIIFCMFLNMAMRDWNMERWEEMLIRRNVEKEVSRTLRNR